MTLRRGFLRGVLHGTGLVISGAVFFAATIVLLTGVSLDVYDWRTFGALVLTLISGGLFVLLFALITA